MGPKLQELLDGADKTQADLARHLKIKPPRVSEMVRGNRRMQVHEIPLAADFFGISIERMTAMAAGKPDPGELPKERAGRSVFGGRHTRGGSFPTSSETAASSRHLEIWESTEGGEMGAMLITSRPFGVYLVDDTMSPAYERGEQLFIDPNRTPHPGDNCLFVKEISAGSYLALARRLVRSSADKWRVRQFKPPKDFDLDRKSWKAWPIVGKMVPP